MNVSGIDSLVYYKLGNKRILLLGECHSTDRWCEPSRENSIKVSDFVEEITERIPKEECLDIFFEGTYKKIITGYKINSGLSQTSKKLEPPPSSYFTLIRDFLTTWRFRKRKNLRIHYTDARFIPDEKSSLKGFIKFFTSC